jgi:hypothetical protein
MAVKDTTLYDSPTQTKDYAGKIPPQSDKSVEEIYSEKDKEYVNKFLQIRLERARNQRRQIYPEFKDKTYIAIYEEDEKIANTHLPQKKNEDDVIVSAGTVEAKLDTLLAHIANLDLSPEVLAYDKENNKLNEVGTALSDIIELTEENDGGDEGGDEEKKLLRQRELLKHGTVFVQEEWLRLFETKKILKDSYNGQFKDTADLWTESLELVFDGPSRTLLHGPNVFLGDMTEYFMEKQPYVFAVINMDYDVAKAKYGKFENWIYVKKGKVPESIPLSEQTIFDNKWRLTDLKENQVEIILYQDKPRDEFQIIINGVMMLPIGFPLSAVCPGGNYNITKQVFRIINSKFAYGQSFVSQGSIKEISALVDEMLKLFVLKTRKSYSPPYINTSGKVINSRVLSAGRISMGIPPDALVAIGQEGQGVTANEYNILKELQDRIDKSTISNQMAGQQGKSGTTATEVLELQRQAKLTLGLTIIACSLLEKKLGKLRLYNLLANWFEPTDTKFVMIDGQRREMNQYRKTNREVAVPGTGTAERQVIPIDGEVPIPEVIYDLEEKETEANGFPVRKIYISPQGLKTAKITWKIVVIPKEKEGSAFKKLLFREELADIMSLTQIGSTPNKEGLEDELANVYGKNRNKLFAKAQPMGPEMAGISSVIANNNKGRANIGGAPVMPGAAG